VADQVAGASTPSQPPSVLVPVGVLKRNGSTAAADSGGMSSASTPNSRGGGPPENKSVIFSDGIRPGGDLTELDGSLEHHRPLGRRPPKVKHRRVAVRGGGRGGTALSGELCTSKLPPEGLPLVSGEIFVLVPYLFRPLSEVKEKISRLFGVTEEISENILSLRSSSVFLQKSNHKISQKSKIVPVCQGK